MGQILAKYKTEIRQCLRKDQTVLRKRLAKLEKNLEGKQDAGMELENFKRSVEKSLRYRNLRTESVPKISYPDLPVSEKRDEIAAALLNNQVVILCGETGSGKTTQLPKICLELGRGTTGMIGHTQPRRIAARMVSARIAEELGQTVGGIVGYKFRFQDRTKPETLIKVMTDGILLAEIQSDPYLEHYDTIILDEAHERSLNIDFLLGYLHWLLPRRPDLKIIVTSATIDPKRFSVHFDNAPIIEVSGRTYPVDIRYQPRDNEDDDTETDLYQAIILVVLELDCIRSGDILVFLSGEREIREAADLLRKQLRSNFEILPLFSRLSTKEQQRAFQPHQKRRIILATNVAETSLTVPGIRSVIDTGLARISRYSFRSKVQRLPIEKISQASANQRAGRCGRLGPGICIRLYSEEDFKSRPEFTEPEILRTNLASVILQMKAMKLGDIAKFPFVEPPDERMIRDGEKLLHELNALDEYQKLTPVGHKLSRIPIDPRLARMVVAAAQEGCLKEVAVITAVLSIQDPRERPADRSQAADQKHLQFRADDSDFISFLNLWKEYTAKQKELSKSKLRAYCRENFLSFVRLREWQDIHSQVMHVVKKELDFKPNQVDAGYDEIHRALLAGLISNIGFKQDQSEYLGARNLKFYIHPGSSLFKSRPKWVMAGEQVETTRVYARNIAKINPVWVEKAAEHLIKLQHFEPHWEKKSARSVIYERSLLYGITLQSRRRIPYDRIDPSGARELFIRSALVNQLYHCDAEFFDSNQKLLDSLGYLQHKGRRVDLIANEDDIYAFFDAKIPAHVVDGKSFDKWRRKIEKEFPDYLKLTPGDISGANDDSIDSNNYPDHLDIGDLSVDLEYRFEPGHADDGVTSIIPVHQLIQLVPEPFEWLVPGLLVEKVIALIKALPKTARRNFIPAADYAERFLLETEIGTGSLYKTLAGFLAQTKTVSLSASIWDENSLSDHLRMNFRVIDDNAQTLAQSRQLQELQQKLIGQSKTTFRSIAENALSKTGCTCWEFGDLPEQHEISRNGATFLGYPGLVDGQDSVGLQLFDTKVLAESQHYYGLVRLLRLTLRKELKFFKKGFQLTRVQALAYSQLPEHPIFKFLSAAQQGDIYEDISNLIVGTVFIANKPAVRTRNEFEDCINKNKTLLVATANEICRVAESILNLYVDITRKLASLPDTSPLKKDLREQINLLSYSGFFGNTPFARLKEYPRYLKAVLLRLEKSAFDSAKDQKQLGELHPIWIRYWQSVTSDNACHDDEFRWSLEEFRVSLFAQSLKTAYPVSKKRLEKSWQARA